MECSRILALVMVSLCLVEFGDSQASKPQIYYLEIKSYVRFRFATTLVTSKVTNPAQYAQEYTFDVTLPNEAFITNFTLDIGSEIIVGEIKEKAAALQQYERAKERQESAAHIQVKQQRETNKFNIQVNIAAQDNVIFNLTYQELLQRKHGEYNHVIYVNPGQPVNDLNIMVDIQESRDITLLRVPPLRNDILTDIDITATNELVMVQRPDSKSALIYYSPNIEEQTKKSEQGVGGKFVVEYDVERDNDQGDILIVNGYFIHFFAPEGGDIQPMPKDILFVLDVSGSMQGTKIRQLKSAMQNILDDLEQIDRFNIMTFSTRLKYWYKPRLTTSSGFIPASSNNIDAASGFINRLYADSGTNINEALKKGLSLFAARTDKSRTPIIMFLTDGLPTSGVISTEAILGNVKKLNTMKVSIFTLAFGKSANFDLCRQLALQHDGFARKIYQDSDADLQISGLYKEISTLLLRNVTFSYVNSDIDVDSISITDFPTYFNGTEIVVAGKLLNTADQTVNALITATQWNKDIQIIVPGQVFNSLGSDFEGKIKFDEITEKVWAYLTIKQYLTEMETEYDLEGKKKWKTKILEMSLKYHFVTPLTSMVVTLPEGNDERIIARGFDLTDDTRLPKQMPVARTNTRGNKQYSRRPHLLSRITPPIRQEGFGRHMGPFQSIRNRSSYTRPPVQMPVVRPNTQGNRQYRLYLVPHSLHPLMQGEGFGRHMGPFQSIWNRSPYYEVLSRPRVRPQPTVSNKDYDVFSRPTVSPQPTVSNKVISRRCPLVAVRTYVDILGAASPEHYAADTEHSIPLSHIIMTLSTPVLPLSIIAERQAGGEKTTNFSVLDYDVFSRPTVRPQPTVSNKAVRNNITASSFRVHRKRQKIGRAKSNPGGKRRISKLNKGRRRRRPFTPDIVVLVPLTAEPLCMNVPKKLKENKTYSLLTDVHQGLNISGKAFLDGSHGRKRKSHLRQVRMDYSTGSQLDHVVYNSKGSNTSSRTGNRTSHVFDGVTVEIVPVAGYLQVHLVFTKTVTAVNFDGLFDSLAALKSVKPTGNRRKLQLTLERQGSRVFQVPLVRHQLKTPFNLESTDHTHCLYVKRRALMKTLFPRSRI